MSDTGDPRRDTPDDPLDGMFKRIFSDPEFATALERDPEQALRSAGFELDEEALQELRRIREEGRQPELAGAAAIPAVLVVVRVATSPAVRAGTSPAVTVVTRTQVPHREQQQMAERLNAADAAALRADEAGDE